MSLIEWLLESFNPGPVGKVEVNTEEPDESHKPLPKWLIYTATLLGLLLIGLSCFWIFRTLPDGGVTAGIRRFCWFAVYVVASYFVNAKPETSNVGWAGGLINNPFRISDDFNRMLLILQILLLPGKLMAYSLIISWLLARRFLKR